MPPLYLFLAAAHAWVLRSDAPGNRAAAVIRVLVHGADPPVRAQSTLLPVGFISSHKLG